MNIKLFGIVFSICLSVFNVFATDAQMRDGKIVYQSAAVNDEKAFNAKEKQALIDKFVVRKASDVLEIVNINPEKWEVNLTTCVLSYSNFSDFNACHSNDKSAILRKAVAVKRERDNYSDVPNSSEYKDFADRYSWLLSYYNSIP